MSHHVNHLGFANAPISKLIVFGTGVSSFVYKFLPKQYKSLLLFNWADISQKKQIWRIFTSLFVYEKSLDAFCICLLVYHYVILERRWSSKKYLSFILKNWLLSSCLYYSLVRLHLNKYINLLSLYGPLYSATVFYYTDIPRSQLSTGILSFISDKTFVYLIASQALLSSKAHFLIGTCGMISGMIYKSNILRIQSWNLIPNWLIRGISWALSGFSHPEPEVSSQKSLIGATPEIHQDIVFDQMLRNQQQRQNIFRRQPNDGRNVSGQGYAEVLNPTFAQLFQNMNQMQQQIPNGGRVENETPVIQQPVPPIINEPSEEQVQCLLDMGFERGSVMDALRSTNGDLQEATNILLAAS